MQIIAIKEMHLGDSYIGDLLKSKGMGEAQIAEMRSDLRKYIGSFLWDKGIELDEGAYRVLTNMLVHLIEESSAE